MSGSLLGLDALQWWRSSDGLRQVVSESCTSTPAARGQRHSCTHSLNLMNSTCRACSAVNWRDQNGLVGKEAISSPLPSPAGRFHLGAAGKTTTSSLDSRPEVLVLPLRVVCSFPTGSLISLTTSEEGRCEDSKNPRMYLLVRPDLNYVKFHRSASPSNRYSGGVPIWDGNHLASRPCRTRIHCIVNTPSPLHVQVHLNRSLRLHAHLPTKSFPSIPPTQLNRGHSNSPATPTHLILSIQRLLCIHHPPRHVRMELLGILQLPAQMRRVAGRLLRRPSHDVVEHELHDALEVHGEDGVDEQAQLFLLGVFRPG